MTLMLKCTQGMGFLVNPVVYSHDCSTFNELPLIEYWDRKILSIIEDCQVTLWNTDKSDEYDCSSVVLNKMIINSIL